MNKIIIAFESTGFSAGALEFVRRLNEIQPVLVTGLFLPQASYASLWNYSAGGVAGPLFIPLQQEQDAIVIDNNIAQFEKICQHNNIDYRVHKDLFDFALPELKKETRFADLLVIGSESFYKNLAAGQPNEYLRDTLHHAECPVLLVPEHFDFPQTNILSYDGSASSVYAIKQFAYLFPELCKQDTLLVHAKEEESVQLPDEEYISELTARHFNNLTLLKLPVDTKKKFNNWINVKKSGILVSGAFGRSVLSQLFSRSFISEVIADHRLPVFIAHR